MKRSVSLVWLTTCFSGEPLDCGFFDTLIDDSTLVVEFVLGVNKRGEDSGSCVVEYCTFLG